MFINYNLYKYYCYNGGDSHDTRNFPLPSTVLKRKKLLQYEKFYGCVQLNVNKICCFTVDTDLIGLAMHKLSIDNTNVTDILTDCNIYLNKLNRSDIVKAANLMDLNLIFDCLNTTDEWVLIFVNFLKFYI